MDLPDYFDSQAQAAAMLNLSIYDVKAAKAEGCPAFHGGRIRRKEFQSWLKIYRPYLCEDDDYDQDDRPFIGAPVDWKYKRCRRDMLGSLMEYLETALKEKQITSEQFCAIGEKTVPLVVELGQIWKVEFNEKQRAGLERKLARVKEKVSRKAGLLGCVENSVSALNDASSSVTSRIEPNVS
jgi:hypothetical protein